MKKKQLHKGIAMMIASSLLTCTGQLCWKISTQENTLICILAGFILYGMGAICMIFALRFGDLSILHPMLGIGYALSIILGYVVLGEPMYWKKFAGIVVILFGLVCLSHLDKGEKLEE